MRAKLAGGDLAGIGDLDDPYRAHRGRQRHLVHPGGLVDEVHGPVDVGTGVHAHGQMGQIADVPKPDIHRPLHDDGRVVRPVRHAVPDGYGHIDPWRAAGFGHGGPAEPGF